MGPNYVEDERYDTGDVVPPFSLSRFVHLVFFFWGGGAALYLVGGGGVYRDTTQHIYIQIQIQMVTTVTTATVPPQNK